MPVYQFKSKSDQLITISQSIKDQLYSKISITKNGKYWIDDNNQKIKIEKDIFESELIPLGTYTRVFDIPNIGIDSKKPKTVGSLAEKNTEKMVKEGKIKPKKEEYPWWRPNKKVNKSLGTLTNKQKMRYIREGKY